MGVAAYATVAARAELPPLASPVVSWARPLWVALVSTLLLACANRAVTGVTSALHSGRDVAPDAVEIFPLGPKLFLHRSHAQVEGFGWVAANGLLVDTDEGAVIIDTPWTPSQTSGLIDWAHGNLGPVRAVVVTHFHADRTGGLGEVHRRHIPSIGSRLTAKLAHERGTPEPQQIFEGYMDLAEVGIAGELFYPGPGHTLDNIVVYLNETQTLFGGCMVKAAEAKDLGNIADADVLHWPASVSELLGRYPVIKRVVPGHGHVGNADLLRHTLRLLRESAPAVER